MLSFMFLSFCFTALFSITSGDASKQVKPLCLNGGIRLESEALKPSSPLPSPPCRCSPMFHGSQCQYPRCFNGGTLIQLEKDAFRCRCSNSQFIDGQHCETVKCVHGAVDKSGHCRCHNYAKGDFCQHIDTDKVATSLRIDAILILLMLVVAGVLFIIHICLRRKAVLSIEAPPPYEDAKKSPPPAYFP